MNVYGKRCLGTNGLANECRTGEMSYKYTDKMLYYQLLYFSGLFDVEKAKEGSKGGESEGLFSANDIYLVG